MKKRRIRWDRLILVVYITLFSTSIIYQLTKHVIKELKPEEKVYTQVFREVKFTGLRPVEKISDELLEMTPEEIEDFANDLKRQEYASQHVDEAQDTSYNYLGEFLLTGYCACEECSEGWGTLTSTGTTCEAGRTIAVDPDVIPYGTVVIIDGKKFIAEDCGGAINGNHIDVYCDCHEDCFDDSCNGYHDVYVEV